MIRINLVPSEILARERQQQRAIQAIFVAVVCAALVVSATIFHLHQMSRAEKLLAVTKKEYNDKWADIGTKLDTRKKDKGVLETRLGVINDLRRGRALYPYFMADIGKTMPHDAWVTSIDTVRDAAKTQLKVSLAAQAGSARSVTKWLRALTTPAIFGSFNNSAISPISISEAQGGTGKVYSFSLTMIYAPKL